MKNKKTLFIADETLNFTGLLLLFQDFTINNGCYPDTIEMTAQMAEHYRSLLLGGENVDIDKMTYRGIKIVIQR